MNYSNNFVSAKNIFFILLQKIANNILIIGFLTGLLFLVPAAAASNNYNLDEFAVIASNNRANLYFNENTTEFAVEDLQTSIIWFSNPYYRAQDPIARGTNKEKLNEQFALSYYTPEGIKRYKNNYSDSILHEQFTLEYLDKGVRISYTLGQEWRNVDYLPIIISESRFENLILNELTNETDIRFLKDKYQPVTLQRIDADFDRLQMLSIDIEKVFGAYALTVPGEMVGKEQRRNLIELLGNTLKRYRDDIIDYQDITSDDVSQLQEITTYILKEHIFTWDRDAMIEIIKNTSYSPVEKQIDNIKNNIPPPRSTNEVFQIAVEYILEDNNLVVRIPRDDIVYPKDIPITFMQDRSGYITDERGVPLKNERGQTTTLPLHSIELLPLFGAAGSDAEGYMLVPNGSGALIKLNNQKLQYSSYSQQVYGTDRSLRIAEQKLFSDYPAPLPVYGLKTENSAFIAVIEGGTALAHIRADIAGRINNYNKVFAEFTLIPMAATSLQTTTDEIAMGSINIYQSRLMAEDIQLRYIFVEQETPDYVDMALSYQKYLVNKYNLERLSPEQSLPFFIDFIGAVDIEKPVMGAPRRIVEPLTTYTQAREILSTLELGQIENIVVRYLGWLKGGLNYSLPLEIKPEEKIGSGKELIEFIDFLQEKDISFFPDVSFLNVYRDTFFDGFNSKNHAARLLNRKIAKIHEYDPVTFKFRENHYRYIVSPKYALEVGRTFAGQLANYNIQGLSLTHSGSQINSDFRENPDRLIDRTQAQKFIEELTVEIAQNTAEITIEYGNAFMLSYVDNILNLPLYATHFNIIDRQIPFYQIVIHGYINYSGTPINFAQDYKNYLLKLVETGAAPYYKWMYSPSSIVKNTRHNDLYSANYEIWLEEAVEFYNRYQKVKSGLESQIIIGHEELVPGVYKTIYEKGAYILVNYNQEPFEYENIIIPGRDFIRGEND